MGTPTAIAGNRGQPKTHRAITRDHCAIRSKDCAGREAIGRRQNLTLRMVPAKRARSDARRQPFSPTFSPRSSFRTLASRITDFALLLMCSRERSTARPTVTRLSWATCKFLARKSHYGGRRSRRQPTTTVRPGSKLVPFQIFGWSLLGLKAPVPIFPLCAELVRAPTQGVTVVNVPQLSAKSN